MATRTQTAPPATPPAPPPTALVRTDATGSLLVADGAIELTPRMLTPRPGVLLERDAWGGVGEYLETVHGAVQWWLGDWLVLGEVRFGEEHAQYLPSVGVTAETLSQYAWVARNITPERRIYELSWSVYREVADLPPADQQRWLARAEEGTDGVRWSAAELARRMREEAGDEAGAELWVMVRCTDRRDQEAFLNQIAAGGREARATERRAKA